MNHSENMSDLYDATLSRRKILAWSTPVIASVVLPAHAQTSTPISSGLAGQNTGNTNSSNGVAEIAPQSNQTSGGGSTPDADGGTDSTSNTDSPAIDAPTDPIIISDTDPKTDDGSGNATPKDPKLPTTPKNP